MPKSTPNYLSIDANGRVSAAFPGGVDLTAISNSLYGPGSQAIRWHKDAVTGGTIADIGAVLKPDTGFGVTTEIVIGARGVGSNIATLTLDSSPTAAATEVRAQAGARSAKVIDAAGGSDFLPVGILVGQGNNMGPGVTCPFTIPGGPNRNILVRSSMTGYVGAGGLYFHGFQIPSVGTATRDFFYNLTATHMTAGVISGTFTNLPPGNYSVSAYHNVTFDANDRWECSVILTS